MAAVAVAAVSALSVVPGAASASAKQHCTYATGSTSPRIRYLSASGLTCTGARKVATAVRRHSDGWRTTYLDGASRENWDYQSYSYGPLDEFGSPIYRREFRCDYTRFGTRSL
jgi:hypothetical protein